MPLKYGLFVFKQINTDLFLAAETLKRSLFVPLAIKMVKDAAGWLGSLRANSLVSSKKLITLPE